MRLSAIIIAAILALGVATSASAKDATLSVNPAPVAVNQSIVISGEGFKSGENLEVGVLGMPSVFLFADENGTFSVTYPGFDQAGTGTAVAFVTHGHNLVVRASDTFEVE